MIQLTCSFSVLSYAKSYPSKLTKSIIKITIRVIYFFHTDSSTIYEELLLHTTKMLRGEMVGGRDGRPHAELFCVASFVRFWRDSSKLRQPILCTCEMRRPPLLLLLLHIYMYIVLLCRLTAQGLLLLLLLRTWFQSCQTYSHGATKKERARGAVADCAATWQRHLFFTNFSHQRFQSLFNATLSLSIWEFQAIS